MSLPLRDVRDWVMLKHPEAKLVCTTVDLDLVDDEVAAARADGASVVVEWSLGAVRLVGLLAGEMSPGETWMLGVVNAEGQAVKAMSVLLARS